MITLKIISSSTRPGRKGPLVAGWIFTEAQKSGRFNAEVLDLGTINLPLMDESAHPKLKQYRQEHTKQWSASIGQADAFIFVTAEYNFSYPAPLKNALDYLFHEWAGKPAGVVSYSTGRFGGVRAAARLKGDLIPLNIIPLHEGTTIPLVNSFVTPEGEFVPDEPLVQSCSDMFSQLAKRAAMRPGGTN